MHRARWALFLLVIAVSSIHVAAQVNPYKDPTPGVSGFPNGAPAPCFPSLSHRCFYFRDDARISSLWVWNPGGEAFSVLRGNIARLLVLGGKIKGRIRPFVFGSGTAS